MEQTETARISSPPRSSNPRSSASDSTHTDYAFLVHSQNTLRNTLPPNVDNKSLARQRRRRTSPEDQAILEAEFQRNSKPDKSGRKAIVERVLGMGEKEVQIWFQNRRQNCRRRSRPLLPHEVASRASHEDEAPDVVENAEEALETHGMSDETPDEEIVEGTVGQSKGQGDGQVTATNLCGNEGTPGPSIVAAGSASAPYDHTQSVALLSSAVCTAVEAAPEGFTIPIEVVPKSRRSLKRTSSGIRLSLTSEGSARLLQAEDSSPSPPRPDPSATDAHVATLSPSRRKALTSSQTAKPPVLRRGPSGRSRDSRAWSFWCDADSQTRNELALKAQQEETGSAAAAISLMRSSSNNNSSRTVLAPMSASSLRRSDSAWSAKRSRPALGRASTAIARLGGSSHHHDGFELFDETETKTRTQKSAKHAASGLFQSPSGESDKENTDPDGLQPQLPSSRNSQPASGRSRSRLSTGKPVLKQSRTAPSQRSRPKSGHPLKSTTYDSGEQENADPDDEEVASFMAGGRRDAARGSKKDHPSVTSASEEDLSCVRGLLFLSQAGSCG